MHSLQLVLLVSLVLVLGPSWCGGDPYETWSRLSFNSPVPPIVVSPEECPGAVGRNCTTECQLHICEALVQLYRVSNNASDPWDHEHGWEDSKTQSCKQLLADHSTANHSAAQPAYCHWHGVLCCSAEHAAQDHCYLENSVGGLNLAINNLNVSVANPKFFGAVKSLHDCGLTMLDLESNNIAGELSDDWGQLKHLQQLNIGACWLAGPIPEGLRAMENLTVLNLGNNWFNGTMPAWLPDLQWLRVLNLGTQFGGNAGTELTGLLGTIPDRIGELAHLQQLVLEANSLSGHLPEGLCSEDDSSLLVLNVRGNRLEGPATEVQDCINLVQLDLSTNMLTGSLPASSKWEQLATYTVSHNRFSGTWPLALNEARILEYLDISHNELTGLLPPKITLLSTLKSVKMSNNKLSGAVGEDLYYMPSLAVLDLSSNQFVGTTPVAIGLSCSLSELDLSNNSGITGMLPPQLGLLPRLQSVKVTTTHMSCAGIIEPFNLTTNVSCSDPKRCTTPQQFGDPDAPITKCQRDQLLPCFLRFADYAVPREDSSNMKCQPILRKPVEQAQKDCAGSGQQQLGEQATNIPDRITARWDIAPSYYQYQTCECLLGFSAVWDATGTALKCIPKPKHSQHRSIIIAVAVAGAAVLAVALVVFMQYLKTRPRWLRERVLQSKRSKGCPRASKPGDKVLVSILVTDVKDFSDLTRRYPELMNKAMGGHNNIMRKACHAHAGHILDQEGDSWTIAFHESEDAVAFSLQVQQAISGKVWTSKLQPSPAHSTTANPAGSLTTQNSEASASSSIQMLAQQLPQHEGERSSVRIKRNARSASKLHGSFSADSDMSSEWSSSLCQRSRECSFTANASHGDVEAGLSAWQRGSAATEGQQHSGSKQALQGDDTQPNRDAGRQHKQQQQAKSTPGMSRKLLAVPSQQSSEAAPESSFHVSEDSGFGSRVGLQTSASMTVGHRNAGTGASRLYSAGSSLVHRLSRVMRGNSRSSMLPQRSTELASVQELRLSVRIGIATGWLHYGCDVDNSPVTTRAKYYVSDVANGGQVLIDERTFKLVKRSLSALGTVDENGYNDKQLQQMLQARAAARMQMACAVRCCSRGDMMADSFSSSAGKEGPHDYESDAIVVHMGAFAAPALLGPSNSKSPLAATTDGSNPSGDDDDSCEEPPPVLSAQQQAAASRATARGLKPSRSAQGAGQVKTQLVQLYSIAAPGMRRLAHDTGELSVCTAWCQPVRARPDWSQVQKDYFQAPGARAEDLAPSGQQDLVNCLPPLPPVTFVFAEVAPGHGLSHKQHKAELHLLNKAIKRCMVQLIKDLPGGDGYICCCHEHDLKYMVVFRSPVRAVQWCLLMQEALMYMQWPAHILSLPGFHTVLDLGSGQLLFRGPRLRMGVAEGIPSSISPDHMGHANYTGGAVNRAARFMDVAAHPGQLVCDIGFAQRCFEAWPHTDTAPALTPSGRQTWGSILESTCVSPEPIPESSAATDWGDPQVNLMQLMVLRSQSETSGHCRPATGLQGLRSRALHELWYQQQQLKQGQKKLYHRQMQQQQQQFVREQPERAAADDGGGLTPGTGAQAGGSTSSAGSAVHGASQASFSGTGKAANAGSYSGYANNVQPGVGVNALSPVPRFNPLTMSGGAAAVAPLAASATASSRRSLGQYPAGPGGGVRGPVRASYLGSFSFKGSGSYDMVQLQHGVLVGREFPNEAPKGKGMRLSVASGEVSGLQQVQLQIPARVMAARGVYAAVAGVGGDAGAVSE